MNKVYQWKDGDLVGEDKAIQTIQERGLDDWIQTLKLKKMVLIENRDCIWDSMPVEYERMEKHGHSYISDHPLIFQEKDAVMYVSDKSGSGHDVGDQMLSRLVSALNEEKRAVEKVFRLGGDEFAVVMNRLTTTKAGFVKNDIKKVNDTIMSGMNGLPLFSISAGVTFSVLGYNE